MVCRKKVNKKKNFDSLQKQIFKRAKQSGLLRGSRALAIDATGLETRHISKYFKMRKGECTHSAVYYPKLNIACDQKTHLITAAVVSIGPSHDSPQFEDIILDSFQLIKIKSVLADKGYDSEFNHSFCRDFLKINSTVIPVKRNAWHKKWPKTFYRREMKKNFPQNGYGQRWQVESVFSRFKRRYGSHLHAKKWQYQVNEIMFKVLTYNFSIIAA